MGPNKASASDLLQQLRVGVDLAREYQVIVWREYVDIDEHAAPFVPSKKPSWPQCGGSPLAPKHMD